MYALKRLVRGLGSGHAAARQGFSLALAAALVRVPEIEVAASPGHAGGRAGGLKVNQGARMLRFLAHACLLR